MQERWTDWSSLRSQGRTLAINPKLGPIEDQSGTWLDSVQSYEERQSRMAASTCSHENGNRTQAQAQQAKKKIEPGPSLPESAQALSA